MYATALGTMASTTGEERGREGEGGKVEGRVRVEMDFYREMK